MAEHEYNTNDCRTPEGFREAVCIRSEERRVGKECRL